MATLVINNIGGVFPAILARNLPDTGAQKAENLLARTPEFRPLANDANVATAPSGTQTLYRFARKSDGTFNSDPATGWVTSTSYINYVKGQLDDDAKERTYYTFNDGSATPRARDVTGADRILGVPAPAKPAGTLNVVDEFTVDERTADLTAVAIDAEAALNDNQTVSYIGAPHYPVGSNGLRDRSVVDLTNPDPTQVLRLFNLSTATNPTIIDTYSSLPVDQANWVLDTRLGGYRLSITGMNDQWCIPLPAFAKGYTFDTAGATTDLAALVVPGTDLAGATPVPLFTTDQVNELVAYAAGELNTSSDRLKPKYEALRAKFADVRKYFEGDAQSIAKAEIEAFYASSAVSTKITASTDYFAGMIWNMATVINSALPPVSDTSGGAGGGA